MPLIFLSCISGQKTKLSRLPEPLRSENYTFAKTNNILDRVQIPSKTFVDYISSMDGNAKYKAYGLNSREMTILSKHIPYLPKKLSSCILENEVNLVFIENLRGGGMVQFVVSQAGKLSAFIVLNPKLLSTSMQDWYEYRDNSPFFPGNGKIRLEIPVGRSYKAILGILTHEAAHIYDLFNRITPYVDPELVKLGFAEEKPTRFTEDIWLGYDTPKAAFEFAGRLRIRSYGWVEPLDSEYIPYLYDSLSKTPFITLYGSTYWSEDFAETFTWCHLKYHLRIEYSVHAYSAKKKLFSFYPLHNDLFESQCALIQ